MIPHAGRPGRRLLACALSAAILSLVACQERIAPAAQAAPTAQKLPTTSVMLMTADGRRHFYTAEVAATPLEQERGLMYRRSMPRDHGMIFPMNPPRPASFWMSNTYIPLDIIFIAPDGTILNIGRGKPLSLETVDSAGPASAVLELNAGEADRIGLLPGDKVTWNATAGR